MVFNDVMEYLEKQDKELIVCIILELMRKKKVEFSDIAQAHVEYLKELRNGESEKLMKLRSKLINMWCDNKKNIGKNIINLMQEAKDNGWANITQEYIDNSKWNK